MTPWTVAHQVPLPIGFPRQENWSRLQFPSRDLPIQGSNSCLLLQQIDSLPLSHQGSPFKDQIRSDQIRSVAQSCPTFCDPMNHSSQASLSITNSRSSSGSSQYAAAAAAAESLQSCPTLCDSIDGSPPGFAVPEILQARSLEWVTISFSNA